MSLFKAREWWSTTSGYEEFHDTGCLCVGNLDNSPDQHDKVVVGSFQGLVRIYLPQPPTFSPEHVLLEKDLGVPVLQVAVGRFIPDSTSLHLATLHPRELSINTLTWEETDQGRHFTLAVTYRHHLQRTACNMAIGPFGGVKGKDYICVQSMDGQLSFFHHDSPAFSTFLPDFLLPGPLKYIPRTDSLLTVSSARTLQAFRYQTLSVAGSTSHGPGQERVVQSSGKKVVADFTQNLGEHAIDLQVITAPSGPSQILVLGERSVFCFKESGSLRFMKKLDFNPSCMHAYGIIAPQGGEDGPGVVQYLVASHTSQLLVFKDSTLVWAAKLNHSPADVTVGNFKELMGVIVSLDELGHLTCSYLGTDPTLFSSSATTSRELNYQELDKEMKELQKTIKDSQRDGAPVYTDATLVLSTLVEPNARVVDLAEGEEMEEEEDGEGGGGSRQKCVEVKLHLSSSSSAVLRDVTVSITSALPLTTHPSHLHCDEVTPSSHSPSVTPSHSHTITVVCTSKLLPTQRHIVVSATYTDPEGLPRVAEKVVPLPLSLFCEAYVPEKAAHHKITLDSTHTSISLRSLFPSLLLSQRSTNEGESEETGPHNVLGFKLLAGPVVTIVGSKSSERYRIQSESLPAIAVFLEELISRLEEHYQGKEPAFQMSYSDSLPLNEYFEIVDRHFKVRVNISQCRDLLSRHAQQFRAIQKRLLTRFKDKTPVGLAHLDTLLDGTYMQLMALSEKNEAFQVELHECSNELSCATQVINTLLRLSVHMSAEEYAVLQASLSPIVTPDCEQGWEEQTDTAVMHLLHTKLAKTAKEQPAAINAVEMPADNQKLKRHIALFCDRITKGGLLADLAMDANRSLKRGAGTEGEGGQEGRTRLGNLHAQTKPEVISRIPINHAPQKPTLASLPEDIREEVEEDGEEEGEEN